MSYTNAKTGYIRAIEVLEADRIARLLDGFRRRPTRATQAAPDVRAINPPVSRIPTPWLPTETFAARWRIR